MLAACYLFYKHSSLSQLIVIYELIKYKEQTVVLVKQKENKRNKKVFLIKLSRERVKVNFLFRPVCDGKEVLEWETSEAKLKSS